MKVYIASPYKLGRPILNVRKSLEVADKLLEKGFIPFAPLLCHFWHFLSPKTPDAWMTYDLEWVKVCDAVLRLPGKSAGADIEVALAKSLGIPVFYSMDALCEAAL